MTGRQVYEQAMRLLNYTDSYGAVDNTQSAEMIRRAPAVINQVFIDLWTIEKPDEELVRIDMNQDIPLSSKTVTGVMPYGVAMLLAQSENDSDNQSLFSALYNRKRSSVPKPSLSIQDVLPAVSE